MKKSSELQVKFTPAAVALRDEAEGAGINLNGKEQDMRMSSLRGLVGKNVYVEWVKDDDDWHWYTILGIDDIQHPRWFILQGIMSPEGDLFNNKPISVPEHGIESIEEI